MIRFDRAARSARLAGQPFKAGIYRQIADDTFAPKFGTVEIRRHLDVPPGTTAYVLGQSVIKVTPGERIGCQVERTVRDWLSYQLAWDFSGRTPEAKELIPWHEGAASTTFWRRCRRRSCRCPGCWRCDAATTGSRPTIGACSASRS